MCAITAGGRAMQHLRVSVNPSGLSGKCSGGGFSLTLGRKWINVSQEKRMVGGIVPRYGIYFETMSAVLRFQEICTSEYSEEWGLSGTAGRKFSIH